MRALKHLPIDEWPEADRAAFRALLTLTIVPPDFSVSTGIGALLQQWLFFGLIQAVSGDMVRPSEFMRPGVGLVKTAISTKASIGVCI